MLTHGELFAGFGGLSLSVEEAFGAKLAWYAEQAPGPSQILAHHWPDLTNHGDVTTVNWSQVEPVDIISGGSPCQDLSLAGRRAGMIEGTRSNLWESMREAIATIKPTYVVWENVRGALSATATSEVEHCPGCMGNESDCNLRALGRVLGDLSDLGFDAEWRTVLASEHAGAVHKRARIFLLAHARGVRSVERDIPTGNKAPSLNWPAIPREPASGHLRGIDWGKHLGYIKRWERIHGRAPNPFELDGVKLRPNPAFGEWMMGLPAGHVTTAPGVSHQVKWKCIGDGVMPQQAVAALKDMLGAS